MNRTIPGTVALGALLLGGCTTLKTTPIQSDKPREGIGYVLPYTQYAMTLTWRLDYCPADATVERKAAHIVVKVEGTPGSADDANLAFMIDPQDLQSLTAVTSFSAKWIDGKNQLAAINASVEDRTGQIIGNLTKTAINVLKIAGGAPGAPVLAGNDNVYVPCSDVGKKALEKAEGAKAALDAQNDLVDAATAEVKTIADRVATMGTAIDDGTKARLAAALSKLASAKAAQSDATDALTTALKPITFTRKFAWPAAPTTFASDAYAMDQVILNTWIRGGGRAESIYLRIETNGTFGRKPVEGDTSYVPDEKSKGLRYRMPAAGRLLACTDPTCGVTAARPEPDPDKVIAAFDGSFAQLGYVNVLRFRSRAFGTNSFGAELNPDGSLKSVTYEQKAAPLEGGTAALADTSGQLADALDPTKKLKASTDYLKALKDQQDAQAALSPTAAGAEKSALDADTSLLNAQIAKLQAQITVADLQAKLAALPAR